MTKPINDGGPAFPVPTNFRPQGMTLRDYFGGQALIGMRSVNAHASSELTARLCWNDADAMIAARNKATQ